MKKKILALLMCIVMVVGILPVYAFAQTNPAQAPTGATLTAITQAYAEVMERTVTDNMKFHGLVDTPIEKIESRNLRQLVRKVRKYTEFLESNTEFNTEFLSLGDGIAISKYNTKE